MSGYRSHWLWGSIPQPNDNNYEYNYSQVRIHKHNADQFASFMAESDPIRGTSTIGKMPVLAVTQHQLGLFPNKFDALVAEHDGVAMVRSPLQTYPVRDSRVFNPTLNTVPNEQLH